MASVENPNSAAFGKREIGEPIQVYSFVELEFPDSDVSGKRKRGREIDEIPKIVSGGCGGSAMAKPKEKAKASRQVSEFKDTYDLFDFFNQKLSFEREDFDPLRDIDDEDDEVILDEIREAPFDRDAVLKYLKQVRQSFGFDVDVNLPIWLEELRYFIPYNPSLPYCRPYAYKAANAAIDQINADLNSKSYELVEVVKYVRTIHCFDLGFLTLAVKKVGDADEAALLTIQAIVENAICGPIKLDQWMFKPDAPAPAQEA